MYPLRRLSSTLITIALVVLFGFVCHNAYAQQTATYARPYTGGAPNNLGAYGGTILSVYLVDPVSGNPITPAGTPTGGGGSNPTGLTNAGTVGTTSASLASAGAYPHWSTIQNTSASNVLYVRLDGATVTTSNGFAIAPGAALTVPSPLSTAITGIGSAASTSYTIVGY